MADWSANRMGAYTWNLFSALWRDRPVLAWIALFAGGLVLAAALPPGPQAVALFFLYSIPANSCIPLPHEPGLLYFALFAPALPLAVAGTLGAVLAAAFDRRLLGWVFRRPAGEAIRRSRGWQFLTRMLFRLPFTTTAAVSFAGVPPLQAVRVLAAGAEYPVGRYAAAVALGRLPRFYLLALLGRVIMPPSWLMALLTVAFLAWPTYLLIRASSRKPIVEVAVEIPPADGGEEASGIG